jgi:hypothetical protein
VVAVPLSPTKLAEFPASKWRIRSLETISPVLRSVGGGTTLIVSGIEMLAETESVTVRVSK